MLIDRLASAHHIKIKNAFFRPLQIGRGRFNDEPVILAKPLTFMNRSGVVIPYLLKRFNLKSDSLVIICDNLDLAPGEIRFKAKGSSGGQRGLQSVIDVLGTSDFKRLFIGIGRPKAGGPVVHHVLGEPEEAESRQIDCALEKGERVLMSLFSQSIDKVMGWANQR